MYEGKNWKFKNTATDERSWIIKQIIISSKLNNDVPEFATQGHGVL